MAVSSWLGGRRGEECRGCRCAKPSPRCATSSRSGSNACGSQWRGKLRGLCDVPLENADGVSGRAVGAGLAISGAVPAGIERVAADLASLTLVASLVPARRRSSIAHLGLWGVEDERGRQMARGEAEGEGKEAKRADAWPSARQWPGRASRELKRGRNGRHHQHSRRRHVSFPRRHPAAQAHKHRHPHKPPARPAPR